MIFRKNFQKGEGVISDHCKFGAVWSGLRKKSQYIFRKRGGKGTFGNFSENSSVLESGGFPKQLLQTMFELQRIIMNYVLTRQRIQQE